jgi:hypothetical protein
MWAAAASVSRPGASRSAMLPAASPSPRPYPVREFCRHATPQPDRYLSPSSPKIKSAVRVRGAEPPKAPRSPHLPTNLHPPQTQVGPLHHPARWARTPRDPPAPHRPSRSGEPLPKPFSVAQLRLAPRSRPFPTAVQRSVRSTARQPQPQPSGQSIANRDGQGRCGGPASRAAGLGLPWRASWWSGWVRPTGHPAGLSAACQRPASRWLRCAAGGAFPGLSPACQWLASRRPRPVRPIEHPARLSPACQWPASRRPRPVRPIEHPARSEPDLPTADVAAGAPGAADRASRAAEPG